MTENVAAVGESSCWEVCAKRADQGSKPGMRNDGAHVALVIEGGGMRGVVSGGMAAELERRGWTDCFDSIHGSSAGACAAAYFAAGQANFGTRIYYEDINNRTFIDPFRLSGIMDAGYLTDYVMRKTKPLNAGRIVNNNGYLNIVCTNANDGNDVTFDHYSSVTDLLSIIKGSITIPVIGGNPTRARKYDLLDGGLVQQIPLASALRLKATHILVLMTRRKSELGRRTGPLNGLLERSLVRLLIGKPIASLLRVRNEKINALLQQLETGLGPLGEKIELFARDHTACKVDRLSKDTGLLQRAEQEARDLMARFIETGRA